MFLGLNIGVPTGGGIVKSTLERLKDIGTLTFYKNYGASQSTADADYSVGSPTATVTAARSASAPATYVDSSGNINLLTTANVLRSCGGYYDSRGFVAAAGFMSEPAGTNIGQDTYFSQAFATYWRAKNTATVSQSSTITNKYLGGTVGKIISAAQYDGIIPTFAKKVNFTSGTFYTVSALVSGTGTAMAHFLVDGGAAKYGDIITLSSSPKLAILTAAADATATGSFGVVSNDGSSTIYVHTIQIETGKHHSSFIPTTTASLTRPAEILKYDIADNRVPANETLAIKFTPLYDFATDVLVARVLSDTDTKQRILYKASSSAGGSVRYLPNSTDSSSTELDGSEPVKSGIAHVAMGICYGSTDTDNAKIFLNGKDNGLNSNNYTEPLWGTSFYLGCGNVGTLQSSCIISSIAIYSEALSDVNAGSVSSILYYTPISSVPGYFASNASAEAFLIVNQPSAYYVSSVNKTFVTYAGTDLSAYAAYYDHTLSAWSEIYLVGTSSSALRDSHGSPTMLVDSSGYIHIMYGTHGGPVSYKKSTNPYDISSWTAMSSPANLTYPELLQFSDGTIYLFYRNGGIHLSDMGYKTSADGGATWSSFNTVVSNTSPTYAYYWYVRKGVGDTIHIGMIWKDENNSKGAAGDEATHRYNIYYFKYDGTKWVNGAGTDLTAIIPLDHTDLDTAGNNIILYNSGTVKCQIPVVEVDSNDYPYIFFTAGNLLSYTNKLIYWTGAAWTTKTCTGLNCSNMFNMCALQINSTSSLTGYITGANSRVSCGDATTKFRGGDFEVWDSTDTGTTWIRRDSITSLSRELAYPTVVKNGTAQLRVFFCENLCATTVDYTAKVYAYGDSGLV